MLKSKKISLDNTISGLEDSLFTGASEKGTRARLFHPLVEGKLIQGFEGLDAADRARVQLIGTDVERGFIDFTRVE
jgi:exoribonuclease-2